MKKLPMPFILKVHNLIDIISPPIKDPLSDYEPVRRGEAALDTAIRRWDLTGRPEISSITICLPSEKIKDFELSQVRERFYHYLHGQLEDNKDNLFLFRKKIIRVFRNALLFLTCCMGIVAIVANESFFPNMPKLMRSVLKEGFTVIGWVALWRPTELAINEYTQLKKDNVIYQKLLKAPMSLVADDDF